MPALPVDSQCTLGVLSRRFLCQSNLLPLRPAQLRPAPSSIVLSSGSAMTRHAVTLSSVLSSDRGYGNVCVAQEVVRLLEAAKSVRKACYASLSRLFSV